LRIAATQYTLNKRALEIYVSGCSLHCLNCHNPEIQSFDIGKEVTGDFIEQLNNKISNNLNMINEIWILGGEPLLQDRGEMQNFINSIRQTFPNKKYVLFTGFDLPDIDGWCFECFDKIKYGRYDERLRTEDSELASSNQGWWIKNETNTLVW
jgi:anaerobic ribonucleoside-triphosphate reductase activating protein